MLATKAPIRRIASRFPGLFGAALVLLFSLSSAVKAEDAFLAAKPVWPAGRSLEKNLTVGFRAAIELADPRGVELRVTGSTVYRATVNGRHVGYGPARGPHGHYRIDVWDISHALSRGKNVVALEVAGYNVNSYYTLDQPSFLQAEILQGGKVLAATGGPGFSALLPGTRVQRVQRYSFQRPFTEVYRLRGGDDRWKVDPELSFEAVECALDARPLRYLPRRVPYPDFRVRRDWKAVSGGESVRGDLPSQVWRDRSIAAIGPALKGYREGELEVIPSIEMQRHASRPDPGPPPEGAEPFALAAPRYRILDFGLNNTGFIGISLRCDAPTRLVLSFDEVLRRGNVEGGKVVGGDVDSKRLGCVNLIWIDLGPGTHLIETFEPYTFRYLKATALEGKCTVLDAYCREYSTSGVEGAEFRAADKRLERLFAAGRETFRQNTLDTFMDCPSRERAGWLCDSFFTARVAPDLQGETTVERVLVENYLLPQRFEFLPEGMLPMCYPADHNDGVFIPNWAMWLVVQLEEYLARSGDRSTVDAFRGKVQALLDYLAKFRNSDGLLEKLPSWVFVEWSDANNHVQDVNYPSNMLFAGVLSAAGRLYGDEKLLADAERVRETVRRQSFDGTFFVDNALRKPDGSLEVTRNRTEVCQYFAFFFGVATRESHPELWTTLRTKFGPNRAKENPFPEVGLANSFIGNMLRVELLSEAGLSEQILDESIGYLLYMAERTGTLWENVGDYASCNHGFASHVVHTLYRDVLGARKLDRVGKRLLVRFAKLELSSCEGSIPTPDGPVKLAWKRTDDALRYALSTPPGYEVTIENSSGLRLEREK